MENFITTRFFPYRMLLNRTKTPISPWSCRFVRGAGSIVKNKFSYYVFFEKRVSGWQNADVQGVCTLFQGWQGWQEGDRSVRTQSENGQYNNCLPCPNSDEEPLFLWKYAPSGIKFSREFNAKCPAKQCFGRSKPPNSLENLTASCLQASSKRIIQDDFERLKL